MRSKYIHPYYIIAPPYNRTSAGVRVLYKLADLINKNGGSAFIYLRPHYTHSKAMSPNDVAPFLSKKVINHHFKYGLTPIVVYPETMKVKKFDPPLRVRYFLNYDNYLFKNDSYAEDDYLLTYSLNILKKLTGITPKSKLFLPVSDHNFYHPPPPGNSRSGSCFYAGKFKSKFKGKPFAITDGMVEITRDKKDSQSQIDIKRLFQNSEFFYCYEDSALAIEAMLCGCPTIFLPNKHFKEMLGGEEISGIGYAWGYDQNQIQHAMDTVHLFRERYIKLLENAEDSLIEFMENTQKIAENTEYKKPFLSDIKMGPGISSHFLDVVLFIKEIIEDIGTWATLEIILRRLKTKRTSITSDQSD